MSFKRAADKTRYIDYYLLLFPVYWGEKISLKKDENKGKITLTKKRKFMYNGSCTAFKEKYSRG